MIYIKTIDYAFEVVEFCFNKLAFFFTAVHCIYDIYYFCAVRYILKNSEKMALPKDQCTIWREFHGEERFKPMYQPEEDGYMVVSITESKFYTVFNMVVYVHIYLHVYSTDELDLLSPMIEPGLSFGGWVLTENKGIVAQCSVDLLVM